MQRNDTTREITRDTQEVLLFTDPPAVQACLWRYK